jgi:caffeoyl-CoA O-methyltransferase
MTKILSTDEIYQYSSDWSTDQLDVLKQLERETHLKSLKAVMLSGHLQGALLQLISKLIQPKRILEIGTFTGYSAICLAQGLAPEGMLHSVEIDEEKQDIVAKFAEMSGLKDKMVFHFGDAKMIIPEILEEWDLVFIDADKPGYEDYFDLVIDKVKTGGLIIADNTLFDGKVIHESLRKGKNEQAMHAFNIKIKNDKRVEQVILPLRDGISLIRKL